MFKLNEEFVNKFQLNRLVVEFVGSWIISLRPQQPTIGSLVLTLNRECNRFGGITELEAIDLAKAFKRVELLLGNSFKPQKINYLALMMVDNQVHYHIIPRYESPVLLAGIKYYDKTWPKPPSLDPLELSDSSLEMIHSLFTSFSQNIST
ncbi:MAG: hypothetical protein RBT74_13520 [Tenuifilaceae bacterium]|jgi:diadenosine tetraphosphate (Ap4A) HIT family hydrolase|nr:hypothetical protein [Tenuifilaceae bacterium]